MDINAGSAEQPFRDDSEWPINENDLYKMGVRDVSLPAVTKGMEVLMEAGLAPEDVADVIYDNPGILDALKIREYEKARLRAIGVIADHLMQLRDSGVPEDRLLVLSESGLAVGEIAFAIRHIVGCRDGLIEADADGLKRLGRSVYEFYRQGRVTRRPLRPQKPFFERYAEMLMPQTGQTAKVLGRPTVEVGGISNTKLVALPLEFPPVKYQTEETKRAIKDTHFQEKWRGVILTILFIVFLIIMILIWGHGSGPDIGAGG
jgi:hypothetical protein